jgi:hypothetical protein
MLKKSKFPKKLVSLTLSIIMIVSMLYIPATIANAANNVTNKSASSLTVKIDGKPAGSNVAVYPNSVLSFNLTWTVTDKRYIFQDDDIFVYDILTMSNKNYLKLLPPYENISLKINGIEFAKGTFAWSGNTLQYTVAFNNNAKNLLIGGGIGLGSAQFQLTGTESNFNIVFEDSMIGTIIFKPEETPPSGGSGGSGTGPVSTGTWPVPPGPRLEPDIYKGIIADNASGSTLLVDTPKVKVPAYGNNEYYGFTWIVPFHGLQERFENNPESNTDYVIVEETLSANMRFAGFTKPFANYYQRHGMFYIDDGALGETSVSNFFSVEVGLRPFNIWANYAYSGSAGRLAEDPIDNFGVSGVVLYQQRFTLKTTEAEVRNTPLSYAVIEVDGGRQKLVINLGKFGANVAPGEGIKANNIKEVYGVLESCIATLERFLRWLETSLENPYDYLMIRVDELEKLLKTKPGYTGSSAATDFNNLKADLPAQLQYGDPSATYGTGAIAAAYRFLDASGTYANIKAFINGLGASDNAYSLALGIDRMLAGYYSWDIDSYNVRMNNYKNGTYDKMANNYLEGLLFHFPNMKKYFNERLELGLNLSTASFGQIVSAIKTAVPSVYNDGTTEAPVYVTGYDRIRAD